MSNKELSNFELCIDIAKALGADKVTSNNKMTTVTAVFKNRTIFDFNPITDNALNLNIRDELEIVINYFENLVIIYNYQTGQNWSVGFNDKLEINKTVCLAIKESVK